MTCQFRSCSDPATATVLAGATRVYACFTHEREYADRYGSADIYHLERMSPFMRMRRQHQLRSADLTSFGTPRD